ncbi:hypothetical protein V1478_012120 [Vespula squamosa]|uniref:Uncharacterized protein n=1 Tax=Vespula squamosa TaxID=30214 RepID=A0ABD2ACA4_VESSQ
MNVIKVFAIYDNSSKKYFNINLIILNVRRVNYFMYNVDCRTVNNKYIMYKHCISLLKKYLPPQTQKKTNVNIIEMRERLMDELVYVVIIIVNNVINSLQFHGSVIYCTSVNITLLE